MDIRDLYPDFWRKSPEVEAWLAQMSVAADVALSSVEDVMAQANVSTATWGLALWERQLGISPGPGDSEAKRRDYILSRLRTKTASTTPPALARMLEAFGEWEVEISERPADCMVDIAFTGKLGIPPYMDSVQKAVREALPAHIGFAFSYMYLVWSMMDAQGYTWSQIDARAMTWNSIDNGGWLDA